jgi:hypothetical protein
VRSARARGKREKRGVAFFRAHFSKFFFSQKFFRRRQFMRDARPACEFAAPPRGFFARRKDSGFSECFCIFQISTRRAARALYCGAAERAVRRAAGANGTTPCFSRRKRKNLLADFAELLTMTA